MSERYYWRYRDTPAEVMGPASVPQIRQGIRPGALSDDVEVISASVQPYNDLSTAADWTTLPTEELPSGESVAQRAPPPRPDPAAAVILTTAQELEGFRVTRTLEIVTSECVFGMNLFRDFFASVTDVFGGRSRSTQNVLRDARIVCLRELRAEAARVGANAVIAVDLDYSEFSGQGKSMLFLVASGTAVVVEPISQS